MKDFIPFELAYELKKLGFDEHCFGYFDSKSTLTISTNKTVVKDWVWIDNSLVPIDMTLAPLFSQAFRFFREKYNMLANVYSNASGFLFEWHDTIGGTHRYDAGFDGPNDSGCWDTYEEAELACLKKLIEIVKTI
jgi:hypothetical protein